MPRLKGPLLRPIEGEGGWPILNPRLFGSQERGGHDAVPRPDAVPMPWTEVFGRSAPLTLEIGFNRGRFLRALAQAWPDHDHVGIELRRRYAWRVAREMGEAGGPRNARLVWGDARLVAPGVFAAASLAAIFINFPDPWWKRRHAKRRLVGDDFAGMLAGLLAKGGGIWIKTDVPMIAAEIREALEAVPGLVGPVPFTAEDLPPSYRERRCLDQGLPVVRFRFERAQSTANT